MLSSLAATRVEAEAKQRGASKERTQESTAVSDRNGITAATAVVGRTPTVLVRKRLPWLQDPPPKQQPAYPNSRRSGGARPSPQSRTPLTELEPTPESTPESSSQVTRQGEESSSAFKPARVSARRKARHSNSVPVARQLARKHQTDHAKVQQRGVYASSEYSATSSDNDPLPPGLPIKAPASYQKLVNGAIPSSAQSQSSHCAEPWLQGEPDAHTGSHEGSANHHHDGTISRGQRRCESCDAGIHHTAMPSARGLRPDRPEMTELSQGPSVKHSPTLHQLPAHLDAHSEPSSRSNASRELKALRQAVVNSLSSEKPRADFNQTMAVLGNSVQDAVKISGDAAKQDHSSESARRGTNVASAPQQASRTQDSLYMPRSVSPADSMRDSDSSKVISLNVSPSTSRQASAETLPTVFTKSARPSKYPIMLGDTSKASLQTTASEKFTTPRKRKHRPASSAGPSISHTPPRLYQPPSADSIVRDFAYKGPSKHRKRQPFARSDPALDYGLASDYYRDHGESVTKQPGVRESVWGLDKELPPLPSPVHMSREGRMGKDDRVHRSHFLHHRQPLHTRALSAEEEIDPKRPSRRGPRQANRTDMEGLPTIPQDLRKKLDQENNGRDARKSGASTSEPPAFLQCAYYRDNEDSERRSSVATGSSGPHALLMSHNWSLKHPRRAHVSISEGQGFSLGRYHKRQPTAREWNLRRKRLTATIACLNTIFTGLIAGIYAGEVPRIQYKLGDVSHWVIFGNMLFFAGIGLTTLIFWPLPLLHGRRPYTLIAFGLMLPFHIPQALTVSLATGPSALVYVGLMVSRALTGLSLGFSNINLLPTLFDLYGASLMSEKPHQEVVVYDDMRRQGGGVGVWLGIWVFCFTSSLSIGFCVGACIIHKLDASWGFWIIIILLAFFLLVNVISPETRKAAYRRSVHHFYDHTALEKIQRRVARGEVKLHICNDGPKYWWEEVWAGIILTKRMVFQPGHFVLMLYLARIYAQLTLVILLLGALLSRDYRWPSYSIGLAALAVPAGAAVAMPLTKGSWLSRARVTPPRTDSMTMRGPRFTWTSHFVRRIIFSVLLPFVGLAYCLSSPGPPLHWAACVIFAGFMGFLTDLAIAECIGLIMETFDTCDLQPGVNTRRRLQSMSSSARRRRTNYSSFPRVCAGLFAAQSLGFFLASGATVVSGRVTNAYGAQTAISIVAGILMCVTLLYFAIIWRWKQVQVVPDNALHGLDVGDKKGESDSAGVEEAWTPVIIGNPSGKMRRMNFLEMGRWSRWSEIRRLNHLGL